MKKILILAVCCVLALASVVGCGKSAEDVEFEPVGYPFLIDFSLPEGYEVVTTMENQGYDSFAFGDSAYLAISLYGRGDLTTESIATDEFLDEWESQLAEGNTVVAKDIITVDGVEVPLLTYTNEEGEYFEQITIVVNEMVSALSFLDTENSEYNQELFSRIVDTITIKDG